MQIIQDNPKIYIKDDLLNRGNLVNLVAKAIIESIKDNHECYCIGIYGKWGEGKTSFMNFLQERLSGNDNLIISHFNPWMAKDQQSMMIDFFKTIYKDQSEEVKNAMYDYGQLVGCGAELFLQSVLTVSGNSCLGPLGKSFLSFFSKVGELLKKKDEKKNVFNSNNLNEAKRLVSEAIETSCKHLVVFIDDIDRLDKEEIHALFRLIRQIADFKNVIYIIAMDPDIVSKSIGEYFGSGDVEDGRRFIEKIIQVPIQIPFITEMYNRQLLQSELDETWKRNECGTIEELQNVCSTICKFITTRRQTIRLVNQLNFIIPALRGEVNMVDLFILIALKTFDDQVYVRIYAYKDFLFSQNVQKEWSDKGLNNIIKEEFNDTVNNIIRDIDEIHSEYIKEIIYNTFSPYNIYQNEKLNNRNKRICSPKYFMKYFILDVPQEVISEREIDRFSEECDNLEGDSLIKSIDHIIDNYSYSEFSRVIFELISRKKDKIKLQREFAFKILNAFINSKSVLVRYKNKDINDAFINLFFKPFLYVRNLEDKRVIINILQLVYSKFPISICLDINDYYYDNSISQDEGVSKTLISRLSASTYNELIKIDDSVLQKVFEKWSNVDGNGPKDWLLKILDTKDFNAITFLQKFKYKDIQNYDTESIIKIFKEGCIKLCNNIIDNKDNADDYYIDFAHAILNSYKNYSNNN